MKRNQLQQIENRIRWTKSERDRLEKAIPSIERELQAFRDHLMLMKQNIDGKMNEIKKLEENIAKVEKEKDSISDTIFAEFCKRVGIHDIREYENREMKFHQEMQRELKSFDTELARLQYEINFLKSDDRKKREQQEAVKIKELQNTKKDLEKKIKEQSANLKRYEEDLTKAQELAEEYREKVAETEENVVAAKKDVQGIDRNLHSMEKKMKNLEQLELRKAQKRHSLLHECKIAGIEVPLSSGSLQDVMIEEEPGT